eukprot:scaffold54828_cov30-Tisochrysis_lutea.AAC.9
MAPESTAGCVDPPDGFKSRFPTPAFRRKSFLGEPGHRVDTALRIVDECGVADNQAVPPGSLDAHPPSRMRLGLQGGSNDEHVFQEVCAPRRLEKTALRAGELQAPFSIIHHLPLGKYQSRHPRDLSAVHGISIRQNA